MNASPPSRNRRTLPPPPWDVVMAWYQNDWALFGLRNEQLAVALAADPRVRSVLHLEPPVSEADLGKTPSPDQADLFRVQRLRARATMDRQVIAYTPLLQTGDAGRPLNELTWEKVLTQLNAHHIERPLLWLYPPHFLSAILLEQLSSAAAAIVADCTDDHLAVFAPGSDAYHQAEQNYCDCLTAADLVVTTSPPMVKTFGQWNTATHYLPNACPPWHGQGQAKLQLPEGWPRPRVLFSGNLRSEFDAELTLAVMTALPQLTFVVIGGPPQALASALRPLPHVHMLGPRTIDDARQIMAQCDLGICPKERSVRADSQSPLKVFEYLAHDLPVVSTPVAGNDVFGDLVWEATTAADFVAAILATIRDPRAQSAKRKAFVAANQWRHRVDWVLGQLERTMTRWP